MTQQLRVDERSCRIWVTLVGVCLSIASSPTVVHGLTQEELDASQSLWEANGSDSYDYVLQRSCFCPIELIRPGLVEVRAGAIASVTDIETLQPLDPQEFLTIDGLFEELQAAVDLPAFAINAQFDEVLGYPSSIFIDPVEIVADDEVSFVARDVTLVPEPACVVLAILSVVAIAWDRAVHRTGSEA